MLKCNVVYIEVSIEWFISLKNSHQKEWIHAYEDIQNN